MDVTVTEILKRARAQAREATAAREAAQARAAAAIADADAAVEREKDMLAVQAWVEQQATEVPALAEQPESQQVPTLIPTRFGRPVAEIPQTELCRRALEEIGRPALTKEIRDWLAQNGHEFTMNQIRSTLKYMARKPAFGVTTETGSGVWRLQRPSAAAPFRGDTMTGIPAMNGAGGRP